jgi:hypothetical protein
VATFSEVPYKTHRVFSISISISIGDDLSPLNALHCYLIFFRESSGIAITPLIPCSPCPDRLKELKSRLKALPKCSWARNGLYCRPYDGRVQFRLFTYQIDYEWASFHDLGLLTMAEVKPNAFRLGLGMVHVCPFIRSARQIGAARCSGWVRLR